MAANHLEHYVLNANINLIAQIIKTPNFSSKLNISFKSENPTQTGVWFRFHHGTTMMSWGEKITITLTYLNDTTTNVDIHSECGMPTQIIDYGKNKQNVCNVYEEIERQLIHSGGIINNPQPVQPVQPTPIQAPELQPQMQNFCTSCGSPITPDANFCGKCGARLK